MTPAKAIQWMYYGLDDACDYDTGSLTYGSLVTPPIDIPPVPSNGRVWLHYCSTLLTEDDEIYDRAAVLVNGNQYVDDVTNSGEWEVRTADLTSWAGETINVRWFFNSLDDYYNDYHGWQVDYVSFSYSETNCTLDVPFATGDMDCDTLINFNDIDHFVEALVGRDIYEPNHPDCPWMLADCDANGIVNFNDIDPFVTLLVGK